MEKRFKELVAVFGRVVVALASTFGISSAPAGASVVEPPSATSQPENVATRIDMIRKAFENERKATQDAETQRLRQYAQSTQPFDEFNNFVSWLDFQSFQDFHNFGEWNNGML